ncbi:MAG TPA: NAD-dependent epimerase/dehydratase family protein [Hyphomicrobiales bacterium]|nr:NAD-dependent epimerase/dehydratase family protein [Kaistiaceae bacterium]HQF30027.1 NAD-dependent epimerase/dehydratase family protein [Hyphomicrobiales bacterium]
MRIGITGATGFIGQQLIEAALASGVTAVALTRRAAVFPGGVETRVIGDVGGAIDAARLEGLDAIVHLAARVHVMRDTAINPLAAFRAVNVEGTLRLAEAADAAGVRRFVHASSIKVNGEETAPGRPFRADDAPAPVDPYGVSKAEAEAVLHALSQKSGLEVAVVRPPLVYGSGAKGNFARLAGLVARGVPLPFGRIANRRSLVAVENLADLLLTLAQHPQAAGGTFLVSDGEDLSTAGLVTLMAAALMRPARLVAVPVALLELAGKLTGRSAEVHRLTASLEVDIGPTRARLDWAPPVPVDQAITRALRDFPR